MERLSTTTAGAQLTIKQREVLALFGQGLNITQVAKARNLSRERIYQYIRAICHKFDVESLGEVINEGRRRGLI